MAMQQQEQFIDAIFVDYLQRLGAPDHFRKGYERVSHIVEALKSMAKRLKIPVIAGCQISRQAEAKKDARPTMSDLKESGKIEEESDVIVGMYRPEVYAKGFDKKKVEGLAEAIVMKNRNGPIGTANLTFIQKFTRFETLAREGIDYGEDPF